MRDPVGQFLLLFPGLRFLKRACELQGSKGETGIENRPADMGEGRSSIGNVQDRV